ISLVERSPEKAGVGGSTPSLATIISITCTSRISLFGCNSFRTSVDTRTQTAQFVDHSLLAFRYELLIDVQGGRCTRVAHLPLCIFHICTGHFQPNCMRSTET